MRRFLCRLHLWIGLILCAPLVMLGLTGSVLVFGDRIEAWLAPAAAVTTGDAHPADAIVAAARAAAPSDMVPVGYAPPAAPGELATVRLLTRRGGSGMGGDVMRIAVDPVSLATYPSTADRLLRPIFLLHSTVLMKNRDGRRVVGWLGAAMLVMAVSGFVNWWPRPEQWRRAFAVRRRVRGYRLHRELHGAVGIWSLLVLLVVSFAGVALAFPETMRAGINAILPARDLRAAGAALRVQPLPGIPPMTLAAAIDLAQAAFPDATLRQAILPTQPDQPIRLTLAPAGRERGAMGISVFVDPWQRRVVNTLDPRLFTSGERVLAWQHALHAGEGLGPIWKWLVFLCGLMPLALAVTGTTMWLLLPRKARRTAAPASEMSGSLYEAEVGE